MANPLSKDEFRSRLAHVARARSIFIDSGFTKSIDLAWEAYLAVFRELNLSRSAPLPKSPASRPCPVCAFSPLSFKSGCCGRSAPEWSCPRCHYSEIAT